MKRVKILTLSDGVGIEMVAVKKNSDWQAVDHVKTLAQMRTHIEKCKDWLTSAAPDDCDEELQIPPSRRAVLPLVHGSDALFIPNTGIRPEDVPPVGRFVCFLCKTTGSIESCRLINANPFTRAQCMLLCQNCAT